MVKMKRLIVSCAMAMICAPGSASAYDYYYGNDGDYLSCTTFYGATTTSTALTIVGIIYLLSNNGQKARVMQQYLKENETAVQASLRTGSGAAMHDLAQLFGVSTANERRFGAMLRAERAALLAEVPAEGPSEAQAGRFVALVVAGMRADEALALDIGRYEVAGR
jgi:hypothetical protein